MPSDLAIILGLLRFGALSAPEKIAVLDEYQARSNSAGGGPHVWNPCVEVIESLWQYANSCAEETFYDGIFRAEDRRLLGEIATVASSMLDHQQALVDHSAFQTPTGQKLSSLCGEAVARLASDNIEKLPFWDLMCYTCD
jgi:hypothetical protein